MKYNFNTDHYFEIGNSHQVCEDYALDGSYKGVPYVILADGCSSSAFSDFGARIMAFAFRFALFYTIDNMGDQMDHLQMEEEVKKNILQLTMKHCNSVLKDLNLPVSVCDTTLMAAFIRNGKCWLFRCGDGVIMFKDKEGLEVLMTEYRDSAPFYLSYLMEPEREKSWRSRPQAPENREVRSRFRLSHNRLSGNTGAADSFPSPETLPDRKSTGPEWVILDIGQSSLEFVLLVSDGVASYSPAQQGLNGVLRQFSAFKNYHGHFVRRRMKRLKNDMEREGIVHHDDIASAAIFIEAA